MKPYAGGRLEDASMTVTVNGVRHIGPVEYGEVDLSCPVCGEEMVSHVEDLPDGMARGWWACDEHGEPYKDERANQLREQINTERGHYATKDDLKASVEKLEETLKPVTTFVSQQHARGRRCDQRDDADLALAGARLMGANPSTGALYVNEEIQQARARGEEVVPLTETEYIAAREMTGAERIAFLRERGKDRSRAHTAPMSDRAKRRRDRAVRQAQRTAQEVSA